MMEKIIAKYDYVNGNEESESAIQHDLNSTTAMLRGVIFHLYSICYFAVILVHQADKLFI
jgi:hypothetical protein